MPEEAGWLASPRTDRRPQSETKFQRFCEKHRSARRALSPRAPGSFGLSIGVRSLEALSRHGSTSRVLNLNRAHERHGTTPEYLNRPFFSDRILNRSILIKHRLRSDETYLMPRTQQVATKIVFPFDKDELSVGGRSVFVGQMGYKEALAEIVGPDTPQTRRDMETLRLLARLPSLDPFLVREHLRRNAIVPADCYFEISPADMERMRSFVAEQVGELIALAFAGKIGGVDAELVSKLVEALLSADADERLDPLRVTLGLEGAAFKEGVFSWTGFLYYKWQFADTAPRLNRVTREIEEVRAEGRVSRSVLDDIESRRGKIKSLVRAAARECTAIMALYDDAFRDLVNKGHASAFRRFLLESPRLFMDLGQSMGVIAHIASFWGYRFPAESHLSMDAIEFSDLLKEFETSLQGSNRGQKAW